MGFPNIETLPGSGVKDWLKSLLRSTGLLRVWNRHLGGNCTCTRGRNNRVDIGKSLLTRTRIRICGRDNTVVIGDHCRLHDLAILVTGTGHRLEIAAGCQLRGKIKLEDSGSAVAIGPGTTMENGYLGAYEGTRISIGNDCMISDQVGVRTGDMHSLVAADTGARLNPAQDVVIEAHVWLCRGATVMKGCRIGAHSVLGAYSILTGPLPAGVLAVGAPAKVIRTGINWRRERIARAAESGQITAASR